MATNWAKQRRRRQQRQNRILKQEASRPHFQIKYKIDPITGEPFPEIPTPPGRRNVDWSGTTEPLPMTENESRKAKQTSDGNRTEPKAKPVCNVISTVETVKHGKGEVMTVSVVEYYGNPFVRFAIEKSNDHRMVRFVTIKLDHLETIGCALLGIDIDAVKAHCRPINEEWVRRGREQANQVREQTSPPPTAAPSSSMGSKVLSREEMAAIVRQRREEAIRSGRIGARSKTTVQDSLPLTAPWEDDPLEVSGCTLWPSKPPVELV